MRMISRVVATICMAAMASAAHAVTTPTSTERAQMGLLYTQLESAGDMNRAQTVLNGYMTLSRNAQTPSVRNGALYGGLLAAIRMLRLASENNQHTLALSFVMVAGDPVGEVERMEMRPAHFDHALYVWHKILGDATNSRSGQAMAERYLENAVAADPEYARLRDAPPPEEARPVERTPEPRVVRRTTEPEQRQVQTIPQDRARPQPRLNKKRKFRGWRFATGSVNVRDYPSTKGTTVVGRLRTGERVRSQGLVGGGPWFQVNYKGRTAYVHGKFLDRKPPAVAVRPLKPGDEVPGKPLGNGGFGPGPGPGPGNDNLNETERLAPVVKKEEVKKKAVGRGIACPEQIVPYDQVRLYGTKYVHSSRCKATGRGVPGGGFYKPLGGKLSCNNGTIVRVLDCATGDKLWIGSQQSTAQSDAGGSAKRREPTR